MQFMVTRASSSDIIVQEVDSLIKLLELTKKERWPVLINDMGGPRNWQLKIFDDPKMLRSAQAAFPSLFPTLIQAVSRLEVEEEDAAEALQPENKPVSSASHPAHYANNGIEPIDYMRANFTHDEMRGYLQGNIIKYVSRYTRKGGLEDLRKAEVYIGWLIKHEESVMG
jgi:hypothetical protein